MPMFVLNTNVQLSELKKVELLKDLSKTIATILDKPEAYTYVSITETTIVMDGNTEPAGFATLKSIAGLGGEKNNEYAKILNISRYRKTHRDQGNASLSGISLNRSA